MDFFSFFKKNLSKNIAKDRLKLVLVHDRANCSTKMLEMMKNDIIRVILKYIDIDDQEKLDIQITQTSSGENNESVPTLFANIPIKNMRKTVS